MSFKGNFGTFAKKKKKDFGGGIVLLGVLQYMTVDFERISTCIAVHTIRTSSISASYFGKDPRNLPVSKLLKLA